MKKLPLFYKIYLCSTAALAALVLIGLGFFWTWLDRYEKSTPQYAAKSFCLALANKDYDTVAQDTKGLLSGFEGKKELERYFSGILDQKSLKVVKKNSDFSEDTPTFVLLADDKPFLNITLSKPQDGSAPWVISAMDGIRYGCEKVSVSMPTGTKLFLNGIEATGDNASLEEGTLNVLSGLPQGIPKPNLIHLKAERFLFEPEITAQVSDGQAAVIRMKEREYFVSARQSDILQSAHEKMIFELSKVYSNYVSNDRTFADLAAYLIKGSTLYERLRTMEVKYYTPHDSFEFKDMKSANYIQYSEDCFSCEVSFTYILHRGTKAFSYPTKYIFYFVKQDGKFKLAELSLG